MSGGLWPCYLVAPSGDARVTASAWWGVCAKDPYREVGGQHCAEHEIFVGPEDEATSVHDDHQRCWADIPAVCVHCGVVEDIRLKVSSTGMGAVWVRKDTGERRNRVREFPPGALYFADWEDFGRTDAQGRRLYGLDWDNQLEPPLHVVTPSGAWNIDSRASNCTMKHDRQHRCWVRHGVPPAIHVDKSGHTCAAGAGSIALPRYHGFLHNGMLTRPL